MTVEMGYNAIYTVLWRLSDLYTILSTREMQTLSGCINVRIEQSYLYLYLNPKGQKLYIGM